MSRAVTVVAPLILLPLTLPYLGADLYGLWMAVLALSGMAAFADLGLGSGLMTKLAPCYATGDSETARRYISSAYTALSAITLGGCAVLWILAGVVPWPSLFSVDDPALASNARPIALVCLTVFIINVPLSLVVRVRYAYQQVAQSNVWQASGSLWSIPVVVYAVKSDLSPVVVVAASVIGPPVANALSSAWLYLRQLPELAPRLRCADREIARDLFGLGGRFFAVTIVMSLAVNADMLIIAHTLGLAAVTSYAVPARLLGQLGVLVALVNLPLWPANGEALARGNTAWVRTITRRMTFGSVLGVLLPAIPVILVGGSLLEAWLGTPLDASRGLLTALAAWWVLQAAISPRFMVQNSAGVIRPQLIGWSLYLVLSLPLKWIAAQTLGLVAVPAAGVALYAVTVFPSAIWGYRLSIGSPAATSDRARSEPVS